MLTHKELNHYQRLEDDELIAIKWQYKVYGDFFTALFNAIIRADEGNLFRLGGGYPNEVRAYKRWTREEGWAQSIEDKLRRWAEEDEDVDV